MRAFVFCLLWLGLGFLPAQGLETVEESPDDLFARAHQLLSERRSEPARQALPLLRRALQGYSDLGHAQGRAETLYGLAVAAAYAEDRRSAIEWDRQAVAAFGLLGDEVGWSAAHDHWGGLLAESGQAKAAIDHFQLAVETRAALGDGVALASSLHNMASALLQLGQAEAAREKFERALQIHRAVGDEAAEAATLNNLGVLWIYLGRFEVAREVLEHALVLYRRLGDRASQAGSLNNLGLIANQQLRLVEARGYLNRALELYRQQGSSSGLAEVLGNLGWIELRSDPAAAEQRIRRAMALASKSGLERMEAALLGSLGRAQLEQSKVEQAVANLEQAAMRLQSLQADDDLRVALHDLARAQLGMARPDAAEVTIRRAIGLLETSRAELRPNETRAYFFAPRRRLYDFLVDLLMAQGRRHQALVLSESSRARGLLEGLRTADSQAVTTSPIEDSSSLSRLLADAEAWIYHFGEHQSWLWRIHAGGLTAVDLGSSDHLAQVIDTGVQALVGSRRRSQRGPAQRATAQLKTALGLPSDPSRMPARLVLVPDGPLYRVPFAALTSVSQGESPSVSVVPSLGVLAELRNRRAAQGARAKDLLVVADPIFELSDPRLVGHPDRSQPRDSSVARPSRLAFSGVEAEKLKGLLPASRVTVHTGLKAERSRFFLSPLQDYRWLHFATHARVDEQRPEETALMLSRFDSQGRPVEGRLRLGDLAELRLKAQLVTLSACGSAAGKPLTGEGLIGLSRGFFLAGVGGLVASLWDVDDRTSADLMTVFYRLLVGGRDPAAALAAAQDQIRRHPRTSAPFYWAGFVMLGDWK